ncbi:MAG: thiamine diphosphokinase [Chloroflexi bacterium]|nr:thiamine diphosphokinase [Chloroflexota bacterium]
MHCVIVANGEIQDHARLRALWARADLRLAANGGARNARLFLALAPHSVIGDLDSLDADTARWLDTARVEKIQHPRAKDQTDLELALDLARTRGATEITILAALGGRIDQTLANIFLLARAERVRIVTADAELWITRDESEINGQIGDTVSLIALSERVEGIETQGMEFSLRRETLAQNTARGISNGLIAPRARVRIERGMLLIVHFQKSISNL